MDFDFPHIWIEKKYKKECFPYTASATGIRVKYDEELDAALLEKARALVGYLRKNYYFPVRCNIAITAHKRYRSAEDGHIYYGIFYDNENLGQKRKIYPQIAVAGGLGKSTEADDVLHTLLHELTHYFQWFFAENEKRTDRSLEIEATKWASYILGDFNEFYEKSENEGEKL